MNIITYQGFKTECFIDDDMIIEIDPSNRIMYNATPDIFHEFIEIKNQADILNFCNKYGFLRFEIYPGRQFAYSLEKKLYGEMLSTIEFTKNNIIRLIELWNTYNSKDKNACEKIEAISRIQMAINAAVSNKIITDITINYPKNSKDDNGLFLNKKSPLLLKIQCITLKSYLYLMFYETIVKGNIIKVCPACERYFETGVNSNKQICNLPGCDGLRKRNINNVKASRQKDKSIILMSNRINTQLKRRFMDKLPYKIRFLYNDEAEEMINNWKSLQQQYRDGKITYEELEKTTYDQLIEFKNRVNKEVKNK